jgi:hypothetical protein
MPPELPSESQLNEIFQALVREYFPGRRVPFRVEWSRRMSRSAGLCYFRRHVVRLSWKYHAALPAEIPNTLKHELIHATGVLGHGGRFRQEAHRLGCDVHAQPMPRRPYKWVYACPACGVEVKTRRKVDLSCGKCSRRWDPRYRLVMRRAVLPQPAAGEAAACGR